jgi:hypothetical protein
MPGRTFVTSSARREIIAAKCSFTVVTARATERIGPRVMIQRRRRCDLPAARQACSNAVTRGAVQLLRRIVIRVTKTDAKGACLFGRPDQTAELMTGAARRDVPAVCLRVRRVTSETGDVRVHSCGNRERDAAAVGPVTSVASGASVFRVVESRVEAAQRRKGFDLSTLNVRVTDRADLARRICELLLVTTGARRVCGFAGQRRLRRVVLAAVTKQTGKSRVLAIVVFELREVSRR